MYFSKTARQIAKEKVKSVPKCDRWIETGLILVGKLKTETAQSAASRKRMERRWRGQQRSQCCAGLSSSGYWRAYSKHFFFPNFMFLGFKVCHRECAYDLIISKHCKSGFPAPTPLSQLPVNRLPTHHWEE